MNLDKTRCASECTNYECDKRISYRHIKAAESRSIDIRTLPTEDFKDSCEDYVAPIRGDMI